MEMYKLTENYSSSYKKGTRFFLISHSEFIGVKSYVLMGEKTGGKLVVTEDELRRGFQNLKSPFLCLMLDLQWNQCPHSPVRLNHSSFREGLAPDHRGHFYRYHNTPCGC